MRIAIPVEERKQDCKVADVFGRAAYFLIVDTSTNEEIFVKNEAAKSPNGAGIKAAQVVIDYKVDVAILPRIGQKGADLLKSANIKLYKGLDKTALTSITELKQGVLPLLDEVHAGFHGLR